jgi:crotonobetainyl-CoA:carnitine CoA-transferase CaiB-like acyl-CoA transferase
VRAGIAVADSGAGVYLACGVLTGLLERERTGVGRWVRTSLLEAMIALLDFQAARYTVEGVTPEQEGNNHPTIAPMGTFPAADGLFNLAPAGGEMFRKFCAAIGAPEIAERPEFADIASRAKHRHEINVLVAECTRQRTVADWVETLNAAGIPCGPILTIAEMWEDEQVRHLEMAQTIDHPDAERITLVGQPFTFGDDPTNRGVRTPTPRRGQHTRPLLHELGYSDDDIDRLAAEGAI